MTEQAVGWALHALEPDEEIAVVLHLPDCAHCQAAVDAAETAFAQLGGAVEQVEPPPSLRVSLMAAVAETPQVQTPPPAAAPRPTTEAAVSGKTAGPRRIVRADRIERGSWWTRGRLVGASLALIGVIAIGSLAARTVQLQQQRDAATTQASGIVDLVTQLDQPGVKHAMLAGGNGAPVAAVLVVNGQSQVLAMGLPTNPGDHTYVLWGLGAGGTAQPLGAFDVAAAGGGLRTVGSGDADGFVGYAVSLEPGRVAPATPTDVVAKGQVAV